MTRRCGACGSWKSSLDEDCWTCRQRARYSNAGSAPEHKKRAPAPASSVSAAGTRGEGKGGSSGTGSSATGMGSSNWEEMPRETRLSGRSDSPSLAGAPPRRGSAVGGGSAPGLSTRRPPAVETRHPSAVRTLWATGPCHCHGEPEAVSCEACIANGERDWEMHHGRVDL